MNVQQQISQALAGFSAPRGGGGGGGGGVDPRQLEYMMRMDQEDRMGITKERERLQKEQLRQEKQATLGILLQDELMRRQQNEEAQRQAAMIDQAFSREQQARAEVQAASMASLRAKEGAEAENTKRLQEAEDRQKKRMLELLDMQYDLTGDQNQASANLALASESYARLIARDQAWSEEASKNLEKLTADVWSAQQSNVFFSGGLPVAAGMDVFLGRKLANVLGEADSAQATREGLFVEGLTSVIASTGKADSALVQNSLSGIFAAANNKDLPEEERAQLINDSVAKLQQVAGDRGVALFRQGLRSVTDAGSTLVGGTADTVDAEGNRTEGVKGQTQYRQELEKFRSLERVVRASVNFLPNAAPDPTAVFETFMMQTASLMTRKNPKTGVPPTFEEAVALAERQADKFVEGLGKSFVFEDKDAGELRGALLASLTSMLPIDQQIKAMDRFQVESSFDASSQAYKDLLESKINNIKSMEEYLGSLLKERGIKVNDVAKREAGVGTETPEIGAAAAGPVS